MGKPFFTERPIDAGYITESIKGHSVMTNIGAHDIFLGVVRGDIIDGKPVKAIEYTAYKEMAELELGNIRHEVMQKHKLTHAYILHSLGVVKTSEICMFILVSSAHRKAAFEGCHELVELIKKEVPIFGKELFDDGTHQWKENQ